MAHMKLPAVLQSSDQLSFVAEELQAEAEYRRRPRKDKARVPQWSVDTVAALELLPPDQQGDPERWEWLADGLATLVRTAATVHITLAGFPGAELRTVLTEWFRVNTQSDVLVHFHTQPDIAGGMVVRTTNQVHDWSFRRVLLDKSAQLPTLIAGETQHA